MSTRHLSGRRRKAPASSRSWRGGRLLAAGLVLLAAGTVYATRPGASMTAYKSGQFGPTLAYHQPSGMMQAGADVTCMPDAAFNAMFHRWATQPRTVNI